jgi:spore coat polysaccharide biosynthesis protein SpsF
MKILAVTQARYASSRLPGKILKEILGESLLEIHLKRISRSKLISKLKIATTNEPDVLLIENICRKLNLDIYKGSLEDVLERFYFATRIENPDWVVRFTSDCPLIDPLIIDSVIAYAFENDCDYASNTLNPTYPDGMDIEIFKFSALEKAYNEATLKSDREHVTPYIWRNSTYKGGKIFKSVSYENEKNYSHVRLTVDKIEDFIVIEQLVNHLGTDESWEKYTEYLLQHQEINSLNTGYIRNEGYQKSLDEDINLSI